jgi:hypothetical protein
MARRLKLRLDLVPEPLWEMNLRSPIHGLGRDRWNKLRKGIVQQYGDKCVICGSSEKLHGHEVWKYEEKKRAGKATLQRVDVVCWTCHNIMHWGNTVRMIVLGIISHEGHMVLRRHFRTVNKCRQIDFKGHANRSLAVWRRRSKVKWKIDWGPYTQTVAEAKAARTLWRERQGTRTQRKPLSFHKIIVDIVGNIAYVGLMGAVAHLSNRGD